MLREILPAATRSKIYIGYALLGLTIGAIQVGYSAAGAGQPVWLAVSIAVFAFVGTAFGFTASANTPAREPGLGE